jgi:hypothetical protein
MYMGGALGRPLRGEGHQTIFENPRSQKGTDQLEDPLVRDPRGQATHQPVMADTIERAHMFIPLSTTHVLWQRTP